MRNMTAAIPIGSRVCCENAFQAVRANHVHCLKQMTKAYLEERDIYGQTPLHIAAKLNRLQAIEILLREAPHTQDVISRCGENAALVAAGEARTRSVQMLLQGEPKVALARAQQRDINGTTVLMAAVARTNNELALWLLRRFSKALAMQPNNYRMLPLHVAASQGNIDFLKAATKYDSRMTHFRDQFGCTPVFYAVQGGCLNCTRYLVEKAGADISIVSDKGQSLLHVACLAGHAHIARWIMQRSAPVVVLWTTKDNTNAIHCASYSGSVAALGILLNAISQKRRRQVLSFRDSRGNTGLHLAAINNHIDAAQFLLENGAEPRLLNSAGQTAATIARIRKNSQLEKLLIYWIERKHKRNKTSPSVVTEPYVENAYSTSHWSTTSRTLPNGSTRMIPISQLAITPLQRHSFPKYLSDDVFLNNPIYSEVKSEKIRPVTYIAPEEGGRIYEDLSIQTDRDSLSASTKVLDLNEWRESLAAVAQIDRVLQEVDS